MQFEVIRKSHKKSIVMGITVFIVLTILLVARFTFAKYSLVKSIKIAEGTINYKVPDFKIMAMYKNDGSGDIEIDTMPESGYVINESKSYCTLDNVNKDTKARIYTDENGQHIISGLSKYSKCYLYFDKKICKGNECILANVTINDGTPDFSKSCCAIGTNYRGTNCGESNSGVYKANDNDGTSYYFRGSIENNYVKFAGFWWRIIRINGDGTIRLIYDGTSAHANGTATEDSIIIKKQKFSHKDAYWNSSEDNAYLIDNAYVGFKYTIGEVHGLGTKSNVLEQLEIWFKDNLLNYLSEIDINAGFCGDRTPSTNYLEINNTGGTGTTSTYYGGNIRLVNGKTKGPILTCASTSDIYTISTSNKGNKSLIYPIGLISMDEAVMAGGINDINQGYYLYNGQQYWTITPMSGGKGGDVEFFISSDARISWGRLDNPYDLRPVINLRSDTKFTFTGTGEKGTMTNPYIVE